MFIVLGFKRFFFSYSLNHNAVKNLKIGIICRETRNILLYYYYLVNSDFSARLNTIKEKHFYQKV